MPRSYDSMMRERKEAFRDTSVMRDHLSEIYRHSGEMTEIRERHAARVRVTISAYGPPRGFTNRKYYKPDPRSHKLSQTANDLWNVIELDRYGQAQHPYRHALLERKWSAENARDLAKLKELAERAVRDGKRLGKLAGPVAKIAKFGYANWDIGIDLAEQIFNLLDQWYQEPARYNLEGWVQQTAYSACGQAPTHYIFGTTSVPTASGSGCLSGQASTVAQPVSVPYPSNARRLDFMRLTSGTPGTSTARFTYTREFTRSANGTQPASVTQLFTGVMTRSLALSGGAAIAPMLNPNLQRLVNPTFQPWEHPGVTTNRALSPGEAQALLTRTNVITSTATGSALQPPVPPRTVRPHESTPPGKGVKEKKALTRSQRIGVAAARALDTISEASEKVDAVYRALPQEVRDKWNCDGKVKAAAKAGFKGPGGQYGIDGADCKLRALRHNWHLVDASEAWKNIIANEIEDQLYGRAFAAKSKALGQDRAGRSAYRNGWKELNK